MRGLLGRARAKLLVMTTGGVLLQAGVPFQGCDEAVRTALIDGLNGAANTIMTTLIDAFFISINETDATATNATTVCLDVSCYLLSI
jgi:hypothetical protein